CCGPGRFIAEPERCGCRYCFCLRRRPKLVATSAPGWEGRSMVKASSAILMYHSLDSSGHRFSTDPDAFRAQIEALSEARVPIVPLDAIQTTPGAVALTFDDGYRNFVEHALPLLI